MTQFDAMGQQEMWSGAAPETGALAAVRAQGVEWHNNQGQDDPAITYSTAGQDGPDGLLRSILVDASQQTGHAEMQSGADQPVAQASPNPLRALIDHKPSTEHEHAEILNTAKQLQLGTLSEESVLAALSSHAKNLDGFAVACIADAVIAKQARPFDETYSDIMRSLTKAHSILQDYYISRGVHDTPEDAWQNKRDTFDNAKREVSFAFAVLPRKQNRIGAFIARMRSTFLLSSRDIGT